MCTDRWREEAAAAHAEAISTLKALHDISQNISKLARLSVVPDLCAAMIYIWHGQSYLT